jgi:tRNA dimethylallyltransferase
MKDMPRRSINKNAQNLACDAVFIAGPTASGKSALAFALAEALGGSIVNADSMQLYGELPILTAQPDKDKRRRIPHHLYGVLSAREFSSVGRFLVLAAEALDEINLQGRMPLFVGGSGLYLRALNQGLANIPEIPAGVRSSLRRKMERNGPAALREDIARLDADEAERLAGSDPQRLLRAAEVLIATGISLPNWQHRAAQPLLASMRVKAVLLLPDRETLYARIDWRFDAMIAQGALEEVRALLALQLTPAHPAMKALGVPQLARHLAGDSSLEEALFKAKTMSRRYAKRQFTWFRNQKIAREEYITQYSERDFDEILSFIRNPG